MLRHRYYRGYRDNTVIPIHMQLSTVLWVSIAEFSVWHGSVYTAYICCKDDEFELGAINRKGRF